MLFKIKLADRVIEITSLFENTKTFCSEYLTDEPADFSVEISQKDIDFEREKSAREHMKEGKPVQSFSAEYLETLAVYRKIAVKMTDYDTILFHGSVIAVDGVGYLFTAKSGTGKSTHTKLWREVFGNRAVMVNDDKPLMQFTENGVIACGTPWDGKHRLSTNIAVPLKAICILERAEENSIVPVTFKQAYSMLLQQSYRPDEPMAMMKTLKLIDKLGSRVKLYRLGCNISREAAQTAYNSMNERNEIL